MDSTLLTISDFVEFIRNDHGHGHGKELVFQAGSDGEFVATLCICEYIEIFIVTHKIFLVLIPLDTR